MPKTKTRPMSRSNHLCPNCKKNRCLKRSRECNVCANNRKRDEAPPPRPCPKCKTGTLSRQARIKMCVKCYQKRGSSKKVDRTVHTGDDPARDHELQRVKDELARYKKAYRGTVKDDVEEERLIALFKGSIARFPELPKRMFATPAVRDKVAPDTDAVEVPTLLLGDQQIGEVVSADETMGINEYDFQIYQRRLEHLEDRVVDILTHHQRQPFDRLVVFSMGDNVSGVIHEELQKHGHQHIIDQVHLGALSTALFLYRLLRRLQPRGIQTIHVSCVSGNHGRLSKLKEFKQYFKNFDYLFNSIVSLALAGVPEITFNIPKGSATIVHVAGQRILQTHGHELPPSPLGIPLYSINRASAGYSELLSWTKGREWFDYWLLGHFHRPLEMDNTIVNGTMVGMSEMSVGKFKPIRPVQRLLGFHPTWGKSWEYQIRLDLAEPAEIYLFEAAMKTVDAQEYLKSQMEGVG